MDNHVLVPVDGSDPGWNALDYAIENHADDRLTILHVVDPLSGVYGGSEEEFFDSDAFERAHERGERLCGRARERVEEAGAAGAGLETAIETGKPARTIVAYAAEHDVDLIVIGSHGRRGVSRLLLGSVAETVVRRSPVPVTVVR